MNEDILKGKWKQIKGQAKVYWGKLTDDDLTQMDGTTDKLVGRLQERYGYTKEEAEREVNKFLKKYDDESSMPMGKKG